MRNMEIDYSVIIRTTGEAKEKYNTLLKAVANLDPKPREVIVVLPEGKQIPEIQIGNETFEFCKKGMVIQRMTGIHRCRTQYALICDDDVSFESDFVQKLYLPLANHMGEFSVGPLYSFLPHSGVHSILCTLIASAVPTLFHQDRYISILRTTGFSYNRHLKPQNTYTTQSAAWTCFFAKVESLNNIEMESEYWLDSHGYSALDDQTMFYKAWLRGMKTVVVPEAVYNHLDAKTSTRNNKPAMLYSVSFNRIVFWHRFIYSMQKNFLLKIWSIVCIKYRQMFAWIFDGIAVIRKKMDYKDWKTSRKGTYDAWKFIKSPEYLQLPPVCDKTNR